MGHRWIGLAFLLAGAGASAQEGAGERLPTEEAEPWEFRISATMYGVPEGDDYVQPTFMADQGKLHLEARYNYEDLDTGSAWVGLNLSFGEELTLDLTPMVGVVAGATDGVAPGYELSIAWKFLELYAEGEYVFDVEDSEDNFFYAWTELAVSPVEGWRTGLVMQRTRAYETDLEVQAGVLMGFTHHDMDVTAYLFDLGDEGPMVAVTIGFGF